MDMYESAELLRSVLRKIGIVETSIVAGGVAICYRRHQRKALLDSINALSDCIARIEINAILVLAGGEIKNMKIVRVSGKKAQIKHK